MRKKIVKLIESSLPRLYDADGNDLNKKKVADKILDAIPGAERLDLAPFETWIPFACSTCWYNQGFQKGCVYDLMSEPTHAEHIVPDDCPLGYKQR